MTARAGALTVLIAMLAVESWVAARQRASSSGPAVVDATDVYRLRSRGIGAEFEIRVARPLPTFAGSTAAQYSVLYVVDGDLFFGLATDTTRLMHRLFGELPPMLVVGIGYGTADGRVVSDARNRDFTPTADPAAPGSGGGARFLDFLRDEVQPLIAQGYPQATGRSTLFGSSMGGLFASYVALEQPASFDQYIIASPALWWNDAVLLRTADRRHLLRGDAPARIFLAVGSLEEHSGVPLLDGFKLITNARELEQTLRKRPTAGLDVRMHVFDGETHTSVVPVALTRGLRTLYGRGP